MTYAEYMFKAKECTIFQDTTSELWYLDPDWKATLYSQDLGNVKGLSAPFTVTWADVEDFLRLEVERRNKSEDKRKLVMDWLYDLFTQEIDPTMMQEETDYIANVMDYLKFKSEHPEIANDNGTQVPVSDDKIKQLLSSGMSFSKKTKN